MSKEAIVNMNTSIIDICLPVNFIIEPNMNWNSCTDVTLLFWNCISYTIQGY